MITNLFHFDRHLATYLLRHDLPLPTSVEDYKRFQIVYWERKTVRISAVRAGRNFSTFTETNSLQGDIEGGHLSETRAIERLREDFR